MAYNEEWVGTTWAECTLRNKYLRGEFLQEFSADEQSRIAETPVENKPNLWYGTDGGVSPTRDKIFLLSLEEVDKYFGDSGDYLTKRRKEYNGKVDSNGYRLSNAHDSSRQTIYQNAGSWWWLRSPGIYSDGAAYVEFYGNVDVRGLPVKIDLGGVRPALWLNL
jgi:hypothetical protein